MVLDNASPQAGDSTPSAQNDGSNSPVTRYYPLHINTDQLVYPDYVTLIFGFGGAGNWQRKLYASIAGRVENTRIHLQRYPTQEETDAIAYAASRSVYYSRTGYPIGIGVGVTQLLNKVSKSKQFPVFAGGPPAGPFGYPSFRQITQGTVAFCKMDPTQFWPAAAVSTMRMGLWAIGGAALTTTFALVFDMVSLFSDPRMERYAAEMRQIPTEVLQKRKAEAAKQRVQQLQQQHQQRQQQRSGGMSPEPSVYAENQEQGQEQDGYDSSSRGGGYSNEGQDGYSDLNKQAEYKPATPPYSNIGRQYGNGADNNNTRSNNEPQGSDFFDDDDASPTAPEYRTRGSAASSSGGSAWSRIRQQSSQTGSNPQGAQGYSRQPREQWEARNNSSSDSWRSPDQERQHEREQAQADFDRLIEAERNVPNEASGSGQNKGWGRWN